MAPRFVLLLRLDEGQETPVLPLCCLAVNNVIPVQRDRRPWKEFSWWFKDTKKSSHLYWKKDFFISSLASEYFNLAAHAHWKKSKGITQKTIHSHFFFTDLGSRWLKTLFSSGFSWLNMVSLFFLLTFCCHLFVTRRRKKVRWNQDRL